MKEMKDTAEIASAHGKAITPPLSFEFKWPEFENADEIRAAGEWPNEKTIVKMVNADAKTKAYAEQRAATLKANGIEKPTMATDNQLILKNIYDGLRASNQSHDEARATASAVTGHAWTSDYRKDPK